MVGRKDLAGNRIMIWRYPAEVTLNVFNLVNKPMVSAHWNDGLVHINTMYHIFLSHQRQSMCFVTACLSTLVNLVVFAIEAVEDEAVSLSALGSTRAQPQPCAIDR